MKHWLIVGNNWQDYCSKKDYGWIVFYRIFRWSDPAVCVYDRVYVYEAPNLTTHEIGIFKTLEEAKKFVEDLDNSINKKKRTKL